MTKALSGPVTNLQIARQILVLRAFGHGLRLFRSLGPAP